jgi:uncharacterized Zn-binding protein involved in type VI secretion
MGDAEFAGGGSVDWTVTNSDGESGGGDKKQCKGKDKDPKIGGSFAVLVNGKLVATSPATKGNTITVLWGPDADPYTSGTAQTNQAPPRSK